MGQNQLCHRGSVRSGEEGDQYQYKTEDGCFSSLRRPSLKGKTCEWSDEVGEALLQMVSKIPKLGQDTDRVPTKLVVPMAGTPVCEAKGSCLV